MPIIKKPDYTIFASEAKNGELSAFPDLLRGWGVTIDQTAGKPPMEWFNTLQKRTDEWLTYLSQRGISEWDNTLDYPKNAVVQSGGNFYVSITENKSKSPDKSQSDWKSMADALNIKIQDATLTSKGIVQLSNATDSASEVMAAT
ncbi:phage tail protein, partial [Yersinia pestis]